jgi:hypothetical protein
VSRLIRDPLGCVDVHGVKSVSPVLDIETDRVDDTVGASKCIGNWPLVTNVGLDRLELRIVQAEQPLAPIRMPWDNSNGKIALAEMPDDAAAEKTGSAKNGDDATVHDLPGVLGLDRPSARASDAILQGLLSLTPGTVSTTEHFVLRFESMPDDASSAMCTGRRQRVNGAFKAIENMNRPGPANFEAFVIVIAAVFALSHDHAPRAEWNGTISVLPRHRPNLSMRDSVKKVQQRQCNDAAGKPKANVALLCPGNAKRRLRIKRRAA